MENKIVLFDELKTQIALIKGKQGKKLKKFSREDIQTASQVQIN